MTQQQRSFLDVMPTTFKKSDANVWREENDGPAQSTLDTWLSDWIDCGILSKPKHGLYEKIPLEVPGLPGLPGFAHEWAKNGDSGPGFQPGFQDSEPGFRPKDSVEAPF